MMDYPWYESMRKLYRKRLFIYRNSEEECKPFLLFSQNFYLKLKRFSNDHLISYQQ